ncbi:DUF362 domain-containing protein [Methanolobus sp. ZRKC2]|uniref:DUF362 domain-containing protein n=1 Tax=Methanolobus sp. ZRKC2 TaxID=3125783 RepID=UPI00324F386C
MDNRVSIVRCSDYSNSFEAVNQSVELIGGLSAIVSKGDRVLLKPNVLGAHKPEDAVTTHPSIVSAVCQLVKKAGGIPVIGDGAGMTHPGATADAFRESGIEAVSKESGVELINFQTAGFVKVDVPEARHFSRLFVSKAVMEADVIISLPKLKTHELTYYTGAVKNMFGALPLKTRKEMHLLAERKLFGEGIIDLYSVAKPHLAIMDAVVGMEGNGPSHGTPVPTGLILASRDCVSLDIVAATMIGFDPQKIPTTEAALERGFGIKKPQTIGVLPENVRINYKPSSTGIIYNFPPFMIRFFGEQFTVRPRIDISKCIQCGACIMNCSAKAIENEDGNLRINDKKCILCYCCRELCPEDAVTVKKSLLAKIVTGT